MKWYQKLRQKAINRYQAGYYPRHTRTPNLLVCGIYGIGYLIADFGPMIINLFDTVYTNIRKLFAFIVGLLIEVSTVIVLLATITFSIFHSIELLQRAGATGGMEYVGVAIFEVVFISSTALMTKTLMNREIPDWASITGFIAGIIFVEVSNITGMADNWTGRIIGGSIPFMLVISEGVLAYRALGESAKEDETKVMDIMRRNRLTVGDVLKAIEMYLTNQKVDTGKMDINKVDMERVDTNRVDMKVDTEEVDRKVDMSKVDMKVDTEKVDIKLVDTDKVDTDKVDTGQVDIDKVDTDGQVDIAGVDIDVVDTSKADKSTVDTAKEDTAEDDIQEVDTTKVDVQEVDKKVDMDTVDTKVDAKVDIEKVDIDKVDTSEVDTNKVDTKVDTEVDTNKVDMSKVDTKVDTDKVDMNNVDTKVDTKVLDISKLLENRKRNSETIEEIERVVQKGIDIKKQIDKVPGTKRLMKETGCNEYIAKEAKKVLDILYPKKKKKVLDKLDQTG